MECVRPTGRPALTRIRRASGLALIALLLTGCGGEDRSSSTPAKPKRQKTEMKFLAQYEKLRTQACPISSMPCSSPSRPSTEQARELEACITQALETSPQLPPGSEFSEAEVNARNTATVQGRIARCNSLQGGVAELGYGRAYGYGYGAAANVTGSPVDVVIR